MKRLATWNDRSDSWRWAALLPLALVVGGVASLAAARPTWLAAAAGAILFGLFAFVSLRRPHVFIVIFLVTLIVLPPLFLPRSPETPLYLSTFMLPVGAAVFLARFPDFRFRLDPVAKGLGIFLLATGLSLPFGFWLSGAEVGAAGLFRWALLAQAALIYVLVRGAGVGCESGPARWLMTVLMIAALFTAASGIFDFFWPVAIPHPAAEQHIWVGGEVLRRAQGVFFEASSFANLCGFFLSVAAAAFIARNENAVGMSRSWLWLAIPILTLAVFVALSRSAWGNVAVTNLVFAAVSRRARFWRGAGFLLALAIPVGILWSYTPELWGYLVDARLGNLTLLFADPNLASSGRYETWSRVVSIMQDNPQYLLFGVGYKTLPFTRLFHDEIITDNGFLNLLLETGVVGLGGFLLFSVSVLRTFLKHARSGKRNLAFWGALLFSFWCGELVQMLAADAYTYWRNMIVFLAVMALTVNLADSEESPAQYDSPDSGRPSRVTP